MPSSPAMYMHIGDMTRRLRRVIAFCVKGSNRCGIATNLLTASVHDGHRQQAVLLHDPGDLFPVLVHVHRAGLHAGELRRVPPPGKSWSLVAPAAGEGRGE